MNNRFVAIIGLIGGFLIGRNWGKIKTKMAPSLKAAEKITAEGYGKGVRLIQEQKEKVEDFIAEARFKEEKLAEKKPKKRKTIKKAIPKETTTITAA